MTKEKMIVALVRVSSDAQDFDSQQTAILEYCKKDKIRIDEWVKEFDVSGYSTPIEERKGLNRIIELAKAGRLQKVIVFNLDRICRGIEGAGFMAIMTASNVEVYSITEGKIKNNTDEQQLLNIVKFWMAGGESKKISLRSAAGLLAVNQSNKFAGGTVNYGYRYNKEEQRLEIDEAEAEVVRFIFDEYMVKGTSELARELREMGIMKRVVGGRYIYFSQSTISKMIKNTIYIGRKQYGGYVKASSVKTDHSRIFNKDNVKYQDYDERLRIIDDDTFNHVQRLIKERNFAPTGPRGMNTRSDVLLEGLMYHKCPDGTIHKMHIKRFTNKEKSIKVSYRCRYCSKNGLETQKSFYAAKFEKIIMGQIMDEINHINKEAVVHKYIEKLNKEKNNMKKELDELKKETCRYNNIINSSNKRLDTFLSEDKEPPMALYDAIERAQKNIRDTNIKIADLQNKIDTFDDDDSELRFILEKTKNMPKIFDELEIADKKAILRDIIDKIIIHSELDENGCHEIEILLKLSRFF